MVLQRGNAATTVLLIQAFLRGDGALLAWELMNTGAT